RSKTFCVGLDFQMKNRLMLVPCAPLLQTWGAETKLGGLKYSANDDDLVQHGSLLGMARGRIPESDIQAIRERAPIEEIVGEYVQLKPAGYDSLKGLSPFKEEKTPS